MAIRPYSPDDESHVIQLWIDCGLVKPQNNPLRDIQRKLGVNPEWFLVGEIDGQIVSTCMAGYEGHRGWVNYLAVSPDCRGQGYGRLMMEAVEERLLQLGCPKLNLQIRATNQAVVEFYRALGYCEDPVVSMGKRLIADQE